MSETDLKRAIAEIGPLAAQALDFSVGLLGALAILVAGWSFARWAQRAAAASLRRLPAVDTMLVPLAASVVRYGIMVVTLVAVLAQFGVNTASILAVLGAVGLAIGLALQGTLQNIAAGIMLLVLRPFHVDEYVEAGSTAGTVLEMGLFTTVMRTWDGIYLSVPNSTLWASTIKNYSRNPTRLMDVKVLVSYEDDAERALAILVDLMRADGRILPDPAPTSMVMELTELGVQLNMRCWAPPAVYFDVKFDLTRKAKRALQEAGLTIPQIRRDASEQAAGAALRPPSTSQ